jgi:predicted CoA-substrate-specific enzyme activase
MNNIYNIGLDIGSTTVKIVVLNNQNNIIYKEYKRHYSNVREAVFKMLLDSKTKIGNNKTKINVTGSGAVDISNAFNIPFIQEVAAGTTAIEEIIPETDVAIELGGEDAKITYVSGQLEQRMNGSCAGGTGAFIDQMAILLETDAFALNELSKDHDTIYPIASRCGVFAKTDIQPLLNEGASKENIAASVFQAVVNQTISGLAQGRPIKGNVAFLGGPLTFLSQLRERFIDTLNLNDDEVIFPDNSQYFVALGAALNSKDSKIINFNDLIKRINDKNNEPVHRKKELDPLFENQKEYDDFINRHDKAKVKRGSIEDYKGKVFLGIDAGSTTTKVALIDEDSRLLYSFYGNNRGNPLKSVVNALKDMYTKLHADITIGKTTVTGYGEHLIKSALKVDIGEIETISHYKAADYFADGVDFVLDIGGQDMKSLKIKNGVIDSVMLNEACSSGCGSFIETFAKSLNLDVETFAKNSYFSQHPVDLGTRCTVFMNSKVKQAQREGATVSDIAAGISVSVIKNALFKVIRLKSFDDLGDKVVVQGGTFYNNAVLRAFEQITNKKAIRPDISGIMGAFGAAIISKERYIKGKSTILSNSELSTFKVDNHMERCGKCGNNCLLTISKFNDGRYFVSGNRCEKGAEEYSLPSHNKKLNKIPNLYDYKYKEVFNYKSPSIKDSPKGLIGIPRVLNMYEDYPFWFTFLTELGYKVVLSGHSTKRIYELGINTIPSESVCYPGKIAHGHIEDLLNKNIKKIFYPCIPYNIKEDKDSGNHYNCPVVTSYPETINSNFDFENLGVEFLKPFVNLNDKSLMAKKLYSEMNKEGFNFKEIKDAVEKGYEELLNYREKVKRKGEEALKYIENSDKKGIVLAGRPYHVDPEINHGIPEMIQSYGFVVLSEDSISHLDNPERPLRVIDQWSYHTRLYSSASFVCKHKDLELVQLNSFGCGLDAVTTDQVSEILEKHNKIYTLIKIDEINNLGAVRIRIRSLIAAMKERDNKNFKFNNNIDNDNRAVFTKKMKEEYTILAPQMSPIHFQFFKAAAKRSGYNIEVLPSVDKEAVNEGLKCVNNDACYPSIITTGQMIKALKSGKYDLNKTALIMSQTGGGCRATNYIAFIRKALKDNGFEHVPVISLNAVGLERHPGFKITPKLLHNLLMGIIYGDVFMKVLYKTRPYEKIKGSADKLYNYWVDVCKETLEKGGFNDFKDNLKNIIKDFDNLEIDDSIKKPKVGIVGEILVKYHPTANNDIVTLLEKEGAEAVVPELLDFFSYSAYNTVIKHKDMIKTNLKGSILSSGAVKLLDYYRKEAVEAFKNSKRFLPPHNIKDLANKAKEHLSLGNQTGEGWFLTAEMVSLLEEGVNNILCLQPFACLPNHITGKGMIKGLKRAYPKANIAPIDYDPGASEVNQINRIKLMLTSAFKNLDPEAEPELDGEAINI